MASVQTKRVVTKGGKTAYIHMFETQPGRWSVYTTPEPLSITSPTELAVEGTARLTGAAFAPGTTFPTQQHAEVAATQALEQHIFSGGDPIDRIEPLEPKSSSSQNSR
jgi:hypothetical protein